MAPDRPVIRQNSIFIATSNNAIAVYDSIVKDLLKEK